MTERTKRTRLLLTGGGARAAYQIGVLKAAGELLPAGGPCPFRVILGTSAGAVAAVALASRIGTFRGRRHRPRAGVGQLSGRAGVPRRHGEHVARGPALAAVVRLQRSAVAPAEIIARQHAAARAARAHACRFAACGAPSPRAGCMRSASARPVSPAGARSTFFEGAPEMRGVGARRQLRAAHASHPRSPDGKSLDPISFSGRCRCRASTSATARCARPIH